MLIKINFCWLRSVFLALIKVNLWSRLSFRLSRCWPNLNLLIIVVIMVLIMTMLHIQLLNLLNWRSSLSISSVVNNSFIFSFFKRIVIFLWHFLFILFPYWSYDEAYNCCYAHWRYQSSDDDSYHNNPSTSFLLHFNIRGCGITHEHELESCVRYCDTTC